MNFHQNQHIENHIAQVVQKGEQESHLVSKLSSQKANQDQNQTIESNQQNDLQLMIVKKETMDEAPCQIPNSEDAPLEDKPFERTLTQIKPIRGIPFVRVLVDQGQVAKAILKAHKKRHYACSHV